MSNMVNEEKMDRRLLLVDDEENILSSLERLLRKEGYTIFRANSGSKGIDILKKHSVGVIVSDQRMPKMTGVEFLSKVKLTHPDTIRIVLSGYTDLKSITDAINDGAIYRFLTKPWDDDLLLKNVAEAFERYEMKIINQWLSEELESANSELALTNKELNINVDNKADEAALNLQILRISQEVLANMPVGIIGIADDGLIAITNKLTDNWITNDSGSILGSMAEESLPKDIFDLYSRIRTGEKIQRENIILPNTLELEVHGGPLGNNSNSGGVILALIKVISCKHNMIRLPI